MRTSFTSLIARVRAKPLISIGAVNALTLPLGLLTSVALARTMPKIDFGHLVYFYSGASLIRLLLNFGLGTGLSRDVAAAWNNRPQLSEVIYGMGSLRLLSFAILLPLLALVGMILPIDLWWPMMGAALAASLADFVFAIVAGSQRTAHIAAMSAFQPTAYLIVAGGLIAASAVSFSAMMAGYTGTFLGMALLGCSILGYTGRIGPPTLHHIRPAYLRRALSFAAPSYLTALASQAWSSGVAGAFGLAGQFERSAEFGIAFSTISLAVAISGPTALTVFFPQASQLQAAARITELRRYIADTLALFLTGMFWISVLLWACAKLIVLFFGARYVEAIADIVALAPVVPLLGALPLLTLSLFAIGRPWRAMAALGAQFITLLLVLLVTRGQLIGAIYCSTGVCVLAQCVALRSQIDLLRLARRLAAPLALAIGLALALAGLDDLEAAPLIAAAAAASALYGGIAFALHQSSTP